MTVSHPRSSLRVRKQASTCSDGHHHPTNNLPPEMIGRDSIIIISVHLTDSIVLGIWCSHDQQLVLLVYRYRVAEGILVIGVRPQKLLSIRENYVGAGDRFLCNKEEGGTCIRDDNSRWLLVTTEGTSDDIPRNKAPGRSWLL